jgi:hypothetical protein
MRHAAAVLVTLIATANRLPALEPPGVEAELLRSGTRLPVVEATIGGETLRLGLDTGTSRTVLSAAAAARLHLVPREAFAVAWVGGAVRTGLCADGPELRVGGFALAVPCLGWVPGENRVADTAGIDGLLGTDALASVDVLLDAPRGRVRLAPAGSLAPWVEGTVLPLEPVGRRVGVRVALPALGGATALLVLDSGAGGVVLFGNVARRAATTAAVRRSTGRLSSGSAGRSVRLVSLGPVRLASLGIDAGTAGVLAAPGPTGEDGLLPLRLLGPVLLDMSAGVLVAHARLRSVPSPLTPPAAVRAAASR